MKIYRPCKTKRVTQKFGENLNGFYAIFGLKGHNGKDYGAYYEETRHNIDTRGSVFRAEYSPTYGNYIVTITKDPTTGKYYKHYYGHLSKINVKVGQYVQTGELLGISGNTGTASTGPHLHEAHYECDVTGKTINQDNGYGGALDDTPWYEDIYVLDYVNLQKKEIGLLGQIIAVVKKLLKR